MISGAASVGDLRRHRRGVGDDETCQRQQQQQPETTTIHHRRELTAVNIVDMTSAPPAYTASQAISPRRPEIAQQQQHITSVTLLPTPS